jgi:hypothetical protein
MLKLKTIALATALGLASMGASASFVTNTQTATFTGVAGNDSSEPGLSPFQFEKFDSSLGNLTGVYVRYDFSIDNGMIGADNLTNEQKGGTAYLGGSLLLDSPGQLFLDSNYATIFDKLDLTQQVSFILEPDPSMSVGGSGPDTFTYNGSALDDGLAWTALGTDQFILDSFLGNAGETFDVSYDTDSDTRVDVPGTQGFFQAVDASISMDLYYAYEEFPPTTGTGETSADVSVPAGIAAAGMALFGLAGVRRRK